MQSETIELTPFDELEPWQIVGDKVFFVKNRNTKANKALASLEPHNHGLFVIRPYTEYMLQRYPGLTPEETLESFLEEAYEGCLEHEDYVGLSNVSWKFAQYNLYQKHSEVAFKWLAKWIAYNSKTFYEDGDLKFPRTLYDKGLVELFHLWGEGKNEFQAFIDRIHGELIAISIDADEDLQECVSKIWKYHEDWL